MAQNNTISKQNLNVQNPKLNLLDGDMVSLINTLIESIKEYYKVSLSNNSDTNQILLYYNQENQNVQILLQDIINNNHYQRINELFDKINSLSKIMTQFQNNSMSCLQNLNLFFDDAKSILRIIRAQRQKQIIENNSKENTLDTSNLIRSTLPSNIKPKLNQIYSKIIQTVNKLSDFNYIIKGTDLDSAEYYNNLQTTIKKELGELINFILKLVNNSSNSNRTSLTLETSDRQRSKSYNNDISKEIGKLMVMNQIKENKIRLLTNKLKSIEKKGNYEADYMNTEIIQNSRIFKLENIIKEKDKQLKTLMNEIKTEKFETEPNNKNYKQILQEKNNQIVNLLQQINIYEQNEQYFNQQFDELNKQFQIKINEYENQIANLKRSLSKYINKRSKTPIKNNIQNFNFNTINEPISRTELNTKIEKYNNNSSYLQTIKKQYMTINSLNKEITEYKNKISQYEQMNKNQLVEMNNNIYKNNKIIEQKDELIKQLREKKDIPKSQLNINMNNQQNNNEIFLLKYENEKLQKENDLLKLSQKGNNISYNNKDLQQINLKLKKENDSLKIKIAKLEENIKNLETEIAKKKEQIDGLQDFIVKLQYKLKNEDFIIQKSETNAKIPKSKSGNIDNADENYTLKIKKLLDLLNKANQDIATLQKKNKELQFKLEEKQVQEEISGYKTDDLNFSNYEEEFDLKKMANGAREKNRSEDINIDYPGMQGIKDKYKDLQEKMNMLIEQVKILISNINCNNNKIKPQISQICQLMKIPAQNIQLIIAGKNKKKALGLID